MSHPPTTSQGSSARAGTALRERELRAAIRREPGASVLTGGQTGVDTVAARAALRAGLRVHLVFPRGLRQEDGPITPARRRALSGAVVHELDSDSFRYRTWTCAYLADTVILLDPAGGEGCQETACAARSLGRPLLVLGREEDSDPGRIGDFLSINRCRVLMIAGCRGSLLAGAHKTRWVQAPITSVISAAVSFGSPA